MTRHPLLPKEYSDSATQAAVLYALRPYKITERQDIINPALKWDLQKAWGDAQTLLAKAHWRHKQDELDDAEPAYELLAYTDHEIDDLNIVIAGIVGYQIMEPDAGVVLRHIEHRKGGEMALAVTGHTLEKLKELLPDATDVAGPEKGRRKWWKFPGWKK